MYLFDTVFLLQQNIMASYFWKREVGDVGELDNKQGVLTVMWPRCIIVWDSCTLSYTKYLPVTLTAFKHIQASYGFNFQSNINIFTSTNFNDNDLTYIPVVYK